MYHFIILEEDWRLGKSFEQNIEWNELDFILDGSFERLPMAGHWLSVHPCDAVLIDISRLFEDSVPFIREQKAVRPNLEFVVLGDFKSFSYILKQIRGDIFYSLVKPVDESELIDSMLKLRQSLDFRNTERKDGSVEKRSECFIIARIQKYIEEHLTGDIGGEQLARRCNMNPSYMSRLFKEETGENLSDYIYRLRMEKAVEYMKTGKYSATQVSEMVGCGTPSYFSVLFKRYTGHSPSDYRKALIS